MRIFFVFLFFVVSCQLLVVSSAIADYVPGQVLVKFKAGVVEKDQSLLQSVKTIKLKNRRIKEKLDKLKYKKIEGKFKKSSPYHVRSKHLVDIPDLSQIYLLTFDSNENISNIVKELKKENEVIYAEPNGIVRALTTTPNDTNFTSKQWGLIKINMQQAWDLTQGNSSTRVAVVDSGADYNHEDLTGKIILGYDYINDDSDPMDDNGHGTHIAGIIGALTNNSKGIAGANWNTKILAVKALNAAGKGAISVVSDAIVYAADNSASVINLSLGDYTHYATLKTAIDYAVAKGCIIVAAAGNENTDSLLYPAAYSNVLAVASTDSSDQRSVWGGSASNYGTWVDISAPGTDIYSTWLSTVAPFTSYAYSDGTSMASPIVAGVASLLLTINPSWSYTQVFNRLKTTATNIDSKNPSYIGRLGSGRVNAQSALSLPYAIINSPTTDEVVSGSLTISGIANALNFSRYTVALGQGSSPTTYSNIRTSSTKVASGTLATYTTTATADGIHTIKLTVENSDPQTKEVTRRFIIDNTPPTATITSPINKATITESINILGTAADSNIYTYILEYSADSGTSYQQISAGTSSITGSTIGSWNTAGLSGSYILRLSVTDKAGQITTTSITITIDNSSTSSKSATGTSYSSPNPFNPQTQSQTYISYNLSDNFNTSVYLFDITGKLIFKRTFVAGTDGGKSGKNMVPWNGRNNFGERVTNGVYLFKVVADNSVLDSGKIIILY